jgi:molybdopterin-binding protein
VGWIGLRRYSATAWDSLCHRGASADTRGAATANVAVTVAGMTMTAAITVDAVDELGLNEGSEVLVIIKASDVMLATSD